MTAQAMNARVPATVAFMPKGSARKGDPVDIAIEESLVKKQIYVADKTDNQPSKNSSSSDFSTGKSQVSSNENSEGTRTLVSAYKNVRHKPEPDDYSKPQT